jgi:glycosyltransferase involved in cell wall biosynthesis
LPLSVDRFEMKKKVGVVIPTHWSAILGGAEYQVSLITEQLIADDQLDVTVISRNVDPSFQPEKYTIKTLKKNRLLGRYSKIFDIRKILSALQETKPDIIYQRSGSAYTGACAWYAQQKKIPWIWHISHDLDVMPDIVSHKSWLKRTLNAIEKKCVEYGIHHASYIIAQTNKQVELLKTYYQRTPDQVIRNFHPDTEAPIRKGKKIKIIWIANFKPIKQPELFVQLAEELENVIDAEFIMIGNSGNPKQYDQLLNKIKSTKSLTYLGEQPQSKVNELLSESHLLVNTSLLEGFYNNFIQAWIREVPVVTLTVDPDDLIKNEGIGICAGSYETLKTKIVDLASSPELRRKMGQKGKAYVKTNHSMRNIDKIHEIVMRLLASAATSER